MTDYHSDGCCLACREHIATLMAFRQEAEPLLDDYRSWRRVLLVFVGIVVWVAPILVGIVVRYL